MEVYQRVITAILGPTHHVIIMTNLYPPWTMLLGDSNTGFGCLVLKKNILVWRGAIWSVLTSTNPFPALHPLCWNGVNREKLLTRMGIHMKRLICWNECWCREKVHIGVFFLYNSFPFPCELWASFITRLRILIKWRQCKAQCLLSWFKDQRQLQPNFLLFSVLKGYITLLAYVFSSQCIVASSALEGFLSGGSDLGKIKKK